MRRLFFLMVAVLLIAAPAAADALDDLAGDFWAWRARFRPFTGDDIPRLERPAGWQADWSPASFAAQRKALVEFEARWKKLDSSRWPVPRQVDYRLMGSAIARVRWELEVTRGWRRNPLFYVDQTLAALHDLLLPVPPLDAERSAEIIRRLESFPKTLADARLNLDQAVAPFARLAIEELKGVRPRMETVGRELKPFLAAESAAKLDAAMQKAITALEGYREWLAQKLPTLPGRSAVGREAYNFFLRHVALMPYTPEELLAMGRQEWERAVSFEAYERNRNRGAARLAFPRDQAEQAAWMKRDTAAVRRFLEENGIQTIPAWVRDYVLHPLPAFLEPLSGLGVNNDFTGPKRLNVDGTIYIPPPSPAGGYFDRVYALDPRTQIAHEGHGHYLQLVLSWANEDPIRRYYYDSGVNEGIAFYNEELMLQVGLFEASPHTREIIYNMMRLRALRVEVDVKLALGLFTIPQAADYLRTRVPMDAQTANHEAAFFASAPGQAIGYQIGKIQILGFLADVRLKQGDQFSLRAAHDFLWKNGNVPLTLQRWEYLGLRDQIDAVDRPRTADQSRSSKSQSQLSKPR